MDWNKEQKEAIENRGQNLLVSAAAGSGKTAVLVERITKLITAEKEENKVSIDSFLIVTFTEAAASEMKMKLRKSLNKMLIDGKEVDFIKKQLELLPTANISTYHAFELDVIRRFFYLIGVEPNSKICDENQSKLLKREALKELKEKCFEGNDQDFLDLLSNFATRKNDDEFDSVIEKTYTKLKSFPDSFKWMEEKVEELKAPSGEGKCTYELAQKLYEFLLAFDKAYMDKKAEHGLIDFSDIEHMSYEILKNEEAAKFYKEKFKYIFIDEYQDSNLMQEEIISLIAGPKNLFMVGDVKQSIYRFRLAEPKLFLDRYKKYTEDTKNSKVIDLNKNYRSTKPIIDFVNKVFEELFENYNEGDRLNVPEGYDSSKVVEYEPKLCLVNKKWEDDLDIDEGLREIIKKQKEALACLSLIKSYLGKEYTNKEGLKDKLKYKDMVILLNSGKGYASDFYEILSKNGIPTFVQDSKGFLDTIEISTLLAALYVVDNPRRDIELLTLLRSEMMNFTIPELVRIRIANKNMSYYDAFLKFADLDTEDKEDGKLKEKVKEALEKIESWRTEEREFTLEDFIWKLMLDTGYYIAIGALPAGAQRQANLRAFTDLARSYSGTVNGTLYEFIKYIEDIDEGNITIPSAKLVGENDDVVKIMTIHKSKGLEFPMVIIPGIVGKLKTEDRKSKVLLDNELGIGIAHINSKRHYRYNTPKYEEIIEKVKNLEIEEKKRVLYVAMTRPRDLLFLVGAVDDMDKTIDEFRNSDNNKSKSFLDMIGKVVFTDDNNIIRLYDEDLRRFNRFEHDKTEANIKYLDSLKEKAISSEIKERMEFKYPFQKDIAVKSKYSVSEMNEKKIYPVILDKPDFVKTEAKDISKDAPLRGTIYHTVLEHLDVKRAREEGDNYLAFLLNSLVEKEILDQAEADVVDIKKVLSFANSDIGERISRSTDVRHERPFNLKIDLDGSPTILRGIIDCFFLEDDKFVLLDYKTGSVKEAKAGELDSIKDKYRLQLTYYKEAIEKSTGKEVKEIYLYMIDVDMFIKLDI